MNFQTVLQSALIYILNKSLVSENIFTQNVAMLGQLEFPNYTLKTILNTFLLNAKMSDKQALQIALLELR